MQPASGAAAGGPSFAPGAGVPPPGRPRKQPRVSSALGFAVTRSRAGDGTSEGSAPGGAAAEAGGEISTAARLARGIQRAVDGCWWACSQSGVGAVVVVGGGRHSLPGVRLDLGEHGAPHQPPLHVVAGDEAWALLGLGRLKLCRGGAIAAARTALGHAGDGALTDHVSSPGTPAVIDCGPQQCASLLTLMPRSWPALASAAALAELIRRGCDARSAVWFHGRVTEKAAAAGARGHVWVLKRPSQPAKGAAVRDVAPSGLQLDDRPSAVVFACEDASSRVCMAAASVLAVAESDRGVKVAVFCLGTPSMTVVTPWASAAGHADPRYATC